MDKRSLKCFFVNLYVALQNFKSKELLGSSLSMQILRDEATTCSCPGHSGAKNYFLNKRRNKCRDWEGLDQGPGLVGSGAQTWSPSPGFNSILLFHLFPSVLCEYLYLIFSNSILWDFLSSFCPNLFTSLSIKSMKADLHINLYLALMWGWQCYITFFIFKASTLVFVFSFLKNRAHVLWIRILPRFCWHSYHRCKASAS